MDLVEIGEKVRQTRKALRLSQSDIASMSGVSRARIDALENGRATDIGFRNVASIMSAVGLDFRMVIANRSRPTLDDLQAEEEELADAPRMGR